MTLAARVLENLPDPLATQAQSRLSGLEERIPATTLNRLPAELVAQLPKILIGSPFIVEALQRDPLMLDRLLDGEQLICRRDWQAFRNALEDALREAADDTAIDSVLRQRRQLEMVRIAWRDIADLADLDETLADLSMLAEHLIDAALGQLFERATARFGTPTNHSGEPQNLIVLGMGKLGARELNFSSDIDLIFAYRDDGELKDRKQTSYSEFYTRLARQLIRALDAPTADGFVFRVDTRLRPFGDSGPLVLHFEAIERYYEAQAREWERYAMIKARTVAGDRAGGADLEAFLRPFVYRRYLDYGAFGELRSLKRMIQQEMRRRGGELNVKLGQGGIREIEFIGQAFQLIRGGREPSLRRREIQEVLKTLEALKLLPPEAVSKLTHGYRTLRRVENRLQQYRDQQTHVLPESADQQQALAYVLDHSDWPSCRQHLERLMTEIHSLFDEVVRLDENPKSTDFPLAATRSDLEAFLQAGELMMGDPLLATLKNFLDQAAVQRLATRGRDALKQLLPPLLTDILATQHPNATLERALQVLSAILGRSVYLSLLCENPNARHRLVSLVAASPWFATTIGRSPLLLDELLDHRSLEDPLEAAAFEQALKSRCQGWDPEDLETFMEILRQFHQVTVLHIAAQDISGQLSLPEVSNALSALAEVLLKAALDQALSRTLQRHGPPRGAGGFGIIAYGKLGGLELGYGSDLDLVFLYEGDALSETLGPKPLSLAEFYGRVAQRVLHLISTQTAQGFVYETDLRLRPSGSSGLLVSSLAAFERYQMEQAWTFEQQALVKARFVAGDPRVGTRFRTIREQVLCRPRIPRELAHEVVEMRQRMQAQLSNSDPALFDLKHDPGGIVDIEFLVQFHVLAGCRAHPSLAEWTDVLRLLERLAQVGRLPEDAARSLRDAYLELRRAAHRAQLDERPGRVEAARFERLRAGVRQLWNRHLADLDPDTRPDPLNHLC